MNFFRPASRNTEQLRGKISKKSSTKLKALCEDMGFKSFQNKAKEELIDLLLTEPAELNKQVNKSWSNRYPTLFNFVLTVLISVLTIIWGPKLKEAYDNMTTEAPPVSKNTNQNKKFAFLMFDSTDYFEKWKREYNFVAGFPKFTRNLDTDAVSKKIALTGIKNAVSHPFADDTRLIVSLDSEVIDSLLKDSLYQKKYNFVPITHRQAENMGFISDYIEQRKAFLAEKELQLEDIKVDSLFRPIFKNRLNSNNYYSGFKGLAVNMVILTKLGKERRNEYLFDYGNNKNRNRISVYFNEDNYLCMRIIDNNSDVFILKVIGNFDNRLLFLNMGFNWGDNALSIRVDDSILIEQEFESKIDFIQDKSSETVLGNSLDHYYGCSFSMRYLKFDVVHSIALNGSKLVYNWQEIDMDEANVFVDDNMKISRIVGKAPTFGFN
ncbi:hypothetical protein J0X14_08475 [Muricauda sp. CAU 1633]|uniref:hypothetical protein n=1 Tax=Allomuricauda sp. CAU 1633 TaxID=2816036 RepID=UPI001A8E7346|nr:hypothetical protein [Muricauda sp. CAU 1633]MBO0322328.1 hypothetical protein [Muricauda sp. CAU 1633]